MMGKRDGIYKVEPGTTTYVGNGLERSCTDDHLW